MSIETNIDDDIELANGLVGGNEKSFELLMDKYTKPLFSICYRMVLDAQIAEDMVQMTFFKIWQNKNKFECGRGRFFSWASSIAYNNCKDYLKKHKELTYDGFENSFQSNDKTADIEIEDLQEQNKIRLALNELNPKQRMAVNLFYFEELSQKHSADIMEISVKAFESLLSRAKAKLKKVL